MYYMKRNLDLILQVEAKRRIIAEYHRQGFNNTYGCRLKKTLWITWGYDW